MVDVIVDARLALFGKGGSLQSTTANSVYDTEGEGNVVYIHNYI